MAAKLAVKRLTVSDLTLFRWHYHHQPTGRQKAKQKAINLNADVFVASLYPVLPTIALELDGRFPIDLYLYGPGLEGEFNLQRKIIKGGTYKNWRLNGELIPNPETNPTRFDILQPGDLVVFEFSGNNDLYPTTARAVFLAQSVIEDVPIYSALSDMIGARSMIALSAPDLARLVDQVDPIPNHPIRGLGLDAAMEDAALGGLDGASTILQRRAGGRMSRTELLRAKENAEFIGRLGEELVSAYLLSLDVSGKIEEFTWDSDVNAVSPYDFRIMHEGVVVTRIDVKSTAGEFARAIHISTGELIEMAGGDSEYVIYRVYETTERGAKLRISKDLRAFARQILEVFQHLPAGVRPDAISVAPELLNFSPLVVELMPGEGGGED